jgi:hypothetical protein
MSDNIHIINLSSYQTPVIQESKRDNWVEFGEDNNYFQYLIDRYTYSTTNNAIINNISRLVYGRGLSALDASKKPNEWAQLMTIFNSDCIKKMIVDRKMLGQFAIQVHYSKDHKSILKAYHMPVNLLRAEKCNKDGEIEGYYYSDNWQDVKKYAPKRIPAYGYSNEQIEILYVKPYTVGMKYYAYPDYQGAIPYAKLEEEIADYLINEVQHGFSGTKVINFNNGIPTEEQQSIITNKVNAQLTGSKGLRTIVAFNASETSKTTVDDIPLNDAPEHYSYLSEECLRKIMLGHNVTSPLLFGIATSTGFSSNADELRNSTILYENMVIKPLQDELVEAIDLILGYNGISLKLYFVKLNPLDAAGDLTMEGLNKQLVDSISNLSPLVANKVLESLTPNEIRGIVGLKPESGGSDLNPELLSSQSNPLMELGEDENPDWILIDEHEVDYDTDETDNELLSKEPKQSLLSKVVNLVSTGDPRPNLRSSQDAVIDGVKFITRYIYAGEEKENGREFCKKMMSLAKQKRVYRKEDILKMGSQAVNPGLGIDGAATYSIWLYKGGANCHHRWNKRVYATLSGKALDIDSKEVKQIAGAKAAKLGYVIKNPSLVSQRPIDMPNQGYYRK